MFKNIINKITALFKNEEGQGMVEYIIIIVLIAIAAIVAFRFLSSKTKQKISEIGKSVERL
ncbi:MAG: Flp family type IVb pilin [candidate division WOR-3 bacterium]